MTPERWQHIEAILDQAEPLDEDARAALRAERVGFVFQNFQLLPTLTALENVLVPLELLPEARALAAKPADARARELLRRVGLADRLGHYPAQLSGGEQQRVAIARALVGDPSILLCDEPTGNLDTRTSEETIELFRKLNDERQITLILVTHDEEIAREANRTIVLRDGSIVEDTTDFELARAALHNRAHLERVN